MGMPRDKTRPARPPAGAVRDKTRPARQKSPILACFRHAGRKISRVLRRHAKQGEFSRADHHTLATQRTPTVQNSPGTQRVRPQPVQNSPSTAKNTQISPFEASREKIIPVETETSDAGRILSRRPPHTSHAGHTHWDKTLPARPHTGAHRYKTLPAQQKTPKSAHSRRAGRKLSRSRPARDTNNRRRANFIPQTTTHQPRWAHSPVQNSPGTQRVRPQPVQNSPGTAQWADLPQNRMQFPQPPNPQRLKTLEFQ